MRRGAPTNHSAVVRITKKAFLEAYRQCGVVGTALYIAGIGRTTYLRWLQRDEKFAEGFADAEADYCDSIRREIARRAIEGVEKLKFYKGQPIINPRTNEPYSEREYSDQLLMAWAKSRMPNEFKDRSEIRQEVGITDNTPLRTVGPGTLERLRAALEQAAAAEAAIEDQRNKVDQLSQPE